MSKEIKLKSYKFGIIAEFIAIIFLSFKGYKILARRYKTYVGEIDIIASKNIKNKRHLIALEVKARQKINIKNKFLFDEIVTRKQTNRIKKSLIHFVKTHKKYQNYYLRFDLIAISPYKMPFHLEGFWE